MHRLSQFASVHPFPFSPFYSPKPSTLIHTPLLSTPLPSLPPTSPLHLLPPPRRPRTHAG
ncbi:hypothetical protein CC85DRAFT_281720 [Cutaneotrichosporon oleaginosum]|uniref:Uncharacterized protein n=1 Tax=Cutaneotrichosporon oleaginosum TaxID=879819 RepID=A0A0J0XYF9_9TREE|nr:uncharacterized protein CC85DRAFT_281720 [Cutaneotrichosporon oleaginosum]KLT46085.1 hypothetical protein CC85DRAFT_281720 [Cutaneotrichosporon oleaginosum]TXT10098.1 hypothetical protein COLE_04032 [Cutaneotrichosporon oleaginosum]